MTPTLALIKLLACCADRVKMGEHSFIVGGAPRDHLLGHEVKDLDVVVESRGGRFEPLLDAFTLAHEVSRFIGGPGVHPDQYGVCHVGPIGHDFVFEGQNLKGQKVEIVTARREKYDRTRGKESHKPTMVEPGTILEDLQRRDFTINTLCWKLSDLREGVEKAPILDLLQQGLEDLRNQELRTPLDPHETFDDDPSRMLRAIRFAAKLNFRIRAEVCQAIQARAEEIRRLPYEAIDGVFFDKILSLEPYKRELALHLMDKFGLMGPVRDLIPEARVRRVLQNELPSARLKIELAGHGFQTGVQFTEFQLSSLTWRANDPDCTDVELEGIFERFLKPLDTVKFMQLTGARGPQVGVAVAKAKDLVLRNFDPDEVMQEVVKANSGASPT